MRILSNAWALLVLIAIAFCAPAQGSADEAELRAEIARLTQENAELRAQLSTCSSNTGVEQSDVLSLLRKLGQQQSGGASFALGFGGGPLIIPEALLRSVVPNEFIILLEGSGDQARTAAQIASDFAIAERDVLHVYDQALSGFAARLSEADRSRLIAREDVLGVAQNGRVFSTGVMGKPAPMRGLQPAKALPAASHIAPIDVYLFDTGIRRAHNDLQGRVRDVGFSFFDNGIAGEDCAGHGTHVAARIAGHRLGVSNAAQLTSVKVIDRFGTGDVATVIAGIDWVMAQSGAHKLVNMSLTRMVTQEPSPLDLAVTALIDSGAIVVVAAGNAAADASDFTPARVARAITVGSAEAGVLSDFSNAGEGVDIYAPGEAILSASIRDVCGVQEMSGTSMAAPYVTGLIADLLASGTASTALLDQVRAQAERFETGAFAGETERYVLTSTAAATRDVLCANAAPK